MSNRPPDWPAGVGRVVLAEVDSTNAEAARRGAALSLPTWILALRQTAGRGRRGRPWADPEGNFAATLVMRPVGAAPALRSFVAALALRDALAALTGRADLLALKWPNDVLISGRKAAGILLEASGQGTAASPLSVGIGVNLASVPPGAALETGALRPVSVLEATGVAIAPETLLDHLAPAFAHWDARLVAEGFAPVRRTFLDAAVRLGAEVTARTGRATVTGIFDDIDAEGALVIRTAEGQRTLPAADIYF